MTRKLIKAYERKFWYEKAAIFCPVVGQYRLEKISFFTWDKTGKFNLDAFYIVFHYQNNCFT